MTNIFTAIFTLKNCRSRKGKMTRYFESFGDFIEALSKAKNEEQYAETLTKYSIDRMAHCFETHDMETAVLLIKICKYISPNDIEFALVPDDEPDYVGTIEDEDGNEMFRLFMEDDELFLERDDPEEGVISISADELFKQIEKARKAHKDDEAFRN